MGESGTLCSRRICLSHYLMWINCKDFGDILCCKIEKGLIAIFKKNNKFEKKHKICYPMQIFCVPSSGNIIRICRVYLCLPTSYKDKVSNMSTFKLFSTWVSHWFHVHSKLCFRTTNIHNSIFLYLTLGEFLTRALENAKKIIYQTCFHIH